MSGKVLSASFAEEHDHLCSQTAQSRISTMSDALKGNPKQTDAQTAPPRSSERGSQKATGKSGHMCTNRQENCVEYCFSLVHLQKRNTTTESSGFFSSFPAIHNLSPRRKYNLVMGTGSCSSTA